MRMTRWDPFREMEALTSRMGGLFPPSMLRQNGEETEMFADWAPAIDVEETDKEYVIKADLPAVKREDVRVAIEDGVLAVEGERRHEKEEKGKKFHRVERSYGKFVRRIAMPTDVDASRVEADFKDGVLNVHLPKSQVAKPRAVDVKVG